MSPFSEISLSVEAGATGAVRAFAVRPGSSSADPANWTMVPLGVNLRDDFFLSTGQYFGFDWYLEGTLPGQLDIRFTYQRGPAFQSFDKVRVTVLQLHATELIFGGPNMHGIKQDNGMGDYVAPHWLDSSSPPDGDAYDMGDRRIPVAYTRSTSMELTGELAYSPTDVLSSTLHVRALGTGGQDFETLGTAGGGVIYVPPVVAGSPLPSHVDFLNPLELSWQVSLDGGTNWIGATRTDSRVYVTLADPLDDPVFETVIHLACSNAAGKSLEADVRDAIWFDFTDRDVRRKPKDGFNVVDNHQLTYYASWDCRNTDTANLLLAGDGQCGAWARFFLDILRVQGIDYTTEFVLLYHIAPPPDRRYGFLVKDWTFAAGTGVSGDPLYPYLNLPDTRLISGPPFRYVWRFEEVDDRSGIPGQGTSNPASLFNNHQIVKIAGRYYDPSYGSSYGTIVEVDDGSLDGFYFIQTRMVDESVVMLDLNGNMVMTDMVPIMNAFTIKKNPIGLNIKERLFEYP